jgi:hypothetical protein
MRLFVPPEVHWIEVNATWKVDMHAMSSKGRAGRVYLEAAGGGGSEKGRGGGTDDDGKRQHRVWIVETRYIQTKNIPRRQNKAKRTQAFLCVLISLDVLSFQNFQFQTKCRLFNFILFCLVVTNHISEVKRFL